MIQYVNDRFYNQIVSYCSSLFDSFNLNHFWYYKLTNDGHISFVGTQPEWEEYFASEKLYLTYPNHRHPKFHYDRTILYKHVEDESLKRICDLCCDFGMRQALVFVNKIPDGIEEFGFSSGTHSDIQTSLFLSEMNLFRLFAKKFKEDNFKLLAGVEDNRVNLSELMGSDFYKNDIQSEKIHQFKVSFLKTLGIAVEEPLSAREIEIIKLISRGYSAGKIAKRAYLSRRTIEHNIERIKDKLCCDSKVDLVQKTRELEQIGCI